MTKNLLVYTLSERLPEARAARIDIHAGDGNLTINRGLDPQLLAHGRLQYLEGQEPPIKKLLVEGDKAVLTLRLENGKQPWIRLPWAACNGATDWQVHLNPNLPAEVNAYSDGGNIRLDLSAMIITRVTAETGGGGIDLVLPIGGADLFASALTGAGNVTINIGLGLRGSSAISASSGAGNVSVFIPDDLAARIHTSTGMGKVLIDPLFSKTNGVTYQSRSFEKAANKIEITLKSGMGNVIVSTKSSEE